MPVNISVPALSGLASLALLLLTAQAGRLYAQSPAPQPALSSAAEEPATRLNQFIAQHCTSCHSGADAEAELDLENLLRERPKLHAPQWEQVIRRVLSRQMPPEGEPQPQPSETETVITWLAEELDQAYFAAPKVESTEALRRLTRIEYQNSIRDLLGVQVEAAALLPPDESSHGFDNITVSDLSPTFLSRAIAAAQKISHLAIGSGPLKPDGATYRLRADITQEEHVPGLPLGTRGGTLIDAHFPQTGEYEITVRLARDRNEDVEGLKEPHELEILIDRQHVKTLLIEPPRGGRSHADVDAHLKARGVVSAGPHAVGVTFIEKSSSLLETKRQPYNAHYNMHRHPRLGPAVYEVSITGPFPTSDSAANDKGEGRTQTREQADNRSEPGSPDRKANGLPIEEKADAKDNLRAAEKDLKRLMRLAYRRPVHAEDLREPLRFFSQGLAAGGYKVGMEQALASILVSPSFLLKLEPTPSSVAVGSTYRIDDLQLASRLSFFLWSSLPDDELLKLAESKRLHEPQVLQAQVLRMLADDRSQSLVDNFAEQWLYLRNLDSITPDLRLFPDFDDNLRQAFRQETKLCFEHVMREDRSVLDLLRSDTTYLNERLAKHYGIPHIYGSRFRPVTLDRGSHRGGLLRQGSILTVTSYATRTSPVIRGHWILKNMIGSPPPPPPPDVPALEDNIVSAALPMRARLAQHRAHAACAVCHNVMDPIGFALENYDAVGRWRDMEDGIPIDASGGLAGGIEVDGVDGLERALLAQPEWFASTMTEKLLTFALGRGVGVNDAPAVRRIVRSAASEEYRFSAIIQGIVASPPFQMRSAQ